MRRFAILADDLTGALDAAAAFASPVRPATVGWSTETPGLVEGIADGVAIDSESRNIDGIDAAQRVTRLLPVLAGSQLAFKKMDSLMRGNTIAELRACCAGGLFGSILVAPAFPAQGRITRRGQQLARRSEGAWQAVGPDLCDALPAGSRHIGRDEPIVGSGIAICDAESDEDLARLADARLRLAAPVLWCGTAGLARALVGPGVRAVRPTGRRRLIVVGSQHWVSVAQLRSLAQVRPELVAHVASTDDAAAAVDLARVGLEQFGVAALAFAMMEQDGGKAARLYTLAFQKLQHLPPPDILVVVGGDTLYRLCQELGTTHLTTVGEWSPGVAVSIIVGGPWDGTKVISKSGAFGDGDFLLSVLAETKGN